MPDKSPSHRNISADAGKRARVDSATGEVHGSGAGAGGGNPSEDYDQDAPAGSSVLPKEKSKR